MKLSLVVSQGVHKGKTIPIPVAQFIIGRDAGCQLRPSSPAVSKRHCAILVKTGKVYLRDFGSTNGTFVNEQPVTGEQEVKDGDQLKVGPLEFVLKMEATTPVAKPAAKTEAMAPAAAGVGAPTSAPLDETGKEPIEVADGLEEEQDKLAAMLLATDDGPEGPLTPSSIPDGTTVFEMPAVGGENTGQPGEKAPDKAAQPLPSTSSAADAILRKYMRRPRT